MKYTILTLILISLNQFVFCQIWDYPPSYKDNYEPNSTIKHDKVKILKIYNFTLENGVRTGEKKLRMEQYFDSLGNTTLTIENLFDTTNYLNSNNVEKKQPKIEFDNLNRPVKKVTDDITELWKYDKSNLIEFSILNSNKIIEKRIYVHEKNKIIHITCNYENNNQQCDTLISYHNEKGDPTKIISVNKYNNFSDTTIMTIEYDKFGNNLGGTMNCNRIKFEYSNLNYRTKILRYNCDGVLVEDEEFEYIMYN